MVVFVLNNRVSASAVDAAGLVAKPGRDCIHLVTCVSNELQKAEAEEVLKGFQKRLLKSMVDTHCEVLVSGGQEGLGRRVEGHSGGRRGMVRVLHAALSSGRGW